MKSNYMMIFQDVELVEQVMIQNNFNEELCVEYLLQFAAVNMTQAKESAKLLDVKQSSPPPISNGTFQLFIFVNSSIYY